MTSLRPSSGPIEGSTVVTVRGVNFPATVISCLFGNQAVTATRISNSLLKCSSPSLPMASNLLVSLLSSPDSILGAHAFEFWFQIQVRHVEPKVIKSSAESLITVIGDNFVMSDSIVCRVGARASTPARFVSSTSLVCPLRSLLPGNHTLDVSFNDQDFVQTESTINVVLGLNPILHPSIGPVAGGQIIEVSSAVFTQGHRLSARFNNALVACNITSNGVGKCKTPRHSPGVVKIEFRTSDSGRDDIIESFYVFEIQSALVLDSIMPTSDTTDGGLILNAIGKNFASTNGIKCMFGSVDILIIYV